MDMAHIGLHTSATPQVDGLLKAKLDAGSKIGFTVAFVQVVDSWGMSDGYLATDWFHEND